MTKNKLTVNELEKLTGLHIEKQELASADTINSITEKIENLTGVKAHLTEEQKDIGRHIEAQKAVYEGGEIFSLWETVLFGSRSLGR